MKRILIYIFLLIICLITAFPQYFRHLDLNDGLSSPSIFAITQDNLGRMWFATKEGVNVYDGISVRAFKGWVDKVWIGNEATAVVTDSIGDVFFLIDNDVIKFSIHNECFSRLTDSSNIRALNSFKEGIVFANADSVFMLNPVSRKIEGKMRLSGINGLNHISADSKFFYLSSRDGLHILNRADGTEKVILPNISVYSTFLSRNGTIWIPTVDNGLYRLNNVSSEPTMVSMPDAMGNAVGARQCRYAIEDRKGKIWYGSFSGLYCYNPKTGKSHRLNIKSHIGGLSHPSVYGLYFDNIGNLWVSTFYGGVNYFSIENDKFINFNYDRLISEEMAHSFIKEMVEDSNHNLWFASDGAGVYCLDREWNIIQHLSTNNPNSQLCQNNARTIEFDPKRNLLFIGTYMGGLSVYDLKTSKVTNYIDNPEFKKIVGGIIHKVKLHGDILFISSANGMSWMDLKSGKFHRIDTGKTSKQFDVSDKGVVYAISADDREAYIISGSTSAHPKTTQLISPKKGITPDQICITDKGVLIGTLGSGIIYFPANSPEPVFLNAANHRFSDDYIYGFCRGKGDVVYASTKSNIVKINMKDLSTQSLNFNNYFPGSHLINRCALYVLDNNEIVVGSTKGLSFINPAEFSSSDKLTKHPKIYFSRLLIQNRDVLPHDQSGIIREALPFSSEIKLPYNTGSFSIIIGLKDYSPSSGVSELEYILEGVDKDWYSTTNNEIKYRNLESGSYTLRVRHPGGEEISLKVVVATPWHLQWWAWIIYITVATALAFIIIRKSISEAKLRKMLKEANLERNQLEKVNQILKGPVNSDDDIENPFDRELVEKVVEIINKNMDNSELDILFICREVGMSRSLFFSKFKNITGLTPKTFILNYRLKYAASLLVEQPHLSVADIAYQSGFSTGAYFSRCFKNQFGISPANYRKSPSSAQEIEPDSKMDSESEQ